MMADNASSCRTGIRSQGRSTGSSMALWGIILGAAVGAVMGAAGHRALRGRRDFSSVSRMEAGRYELMADEETASEVRALLAPPQRAPQ